jgi:hypothetical protein
MRMQLEEHGAALRLLALVLCDIRLAEAYCARYAGPEGHAALLELLLRPGDSRPPLYADACHLLAAQGVYSMQHSFAKRLTSSHAPLHSTMLHQDSHTYIRIAMAMLYCSNAGNNVPKRLSSRDARC